MENERRDDNPPQGENPGQIPQHNQPPQQGGPQGPQPPGWGNQPQQGYPQQNYPPQQGGQPYSNQPPQHAPQQGYYPPPPGYPQSCCHGRNLCGVGGWLMFLCVLLSIVLPILTVFSIASELLGPDPYGLHKIKNYMLNAKINAVVDGLLAVFGFIAGLFLWGRRRKAVSIAKAFIVTYMLCSVAEVAAHVATIKYPRKFELVPVGIVIVLLIVLGVCIAWLAYLCKSKRVALTYGVDKRGV